MFTLKPDTRFNIDTNLILKPLSEASRALAELKGYLATMPNKHILLNMMTLNEAKDSSEIEQIITTHDELYKELTLSKGSQASKEVINYRMSIWRGFELVQEKGFISTNIIVEIQNLIEPNKGGIRKLPGTVIQNTRTGEVVWTPPQSESEIRQYLSDLEQFINTDNGMDPLIKLPIIHFQFEAIHPFYDGNGRTGRILSVLYLVNQNLLDSPILYLSKYILQHKQDYYSHLNSVQTNPEKGLNDWIIYNLKAIKETAIFTLSLIQEFNKILENYAERMRDILPAIYSKELVEALFVEFTTKQAYVAQYTNKSERTIKTYMKLLEENGFVSSQQYGREKIYINDELFRFIDVINVTGI